MDSGNPNGGMVGAVVGSKGGSKGRPRTPRESPDSLISRSYARIIDLISEGEIVGVLPDGVYLDETRASEAGAGFKWEQRLGTQDQTHLSGFPQVENEITVNTELRSDLPWIQSITNPDISAVRVTFHLPRFSSTNQTNGDISGHTVSYQIQIAVDGGPYSTYQRGSFKGKTTGGYERGVRVDLPEGNNRSIKVVRLTGNSSSSYISDTTNIKSYTEIIDAKFRYPNSAVVGVEFDAESFGGAIPTRAYHAKGRIIRVPSNYDAETRTYTGAWNGTFKLSYTNNPAWIYYDILLHPRYGLGDRIDATQIDKWSLYQIGRYCDELVSDGRGGKEPRFTCNLYLQKQADAYKVVQDIASVFRGITYWGAGSAVVSADMPTDPVYTYTNANVKEGVFSYKGSKRGTRYSAVLVTWLDPTDMYRAKVEYVQDDAAIARFGLQTTSLTAFGCTSQGQAQRAGRWALLTNLLETETVSFSVGLEGIRVRPHQVIKVADNNRAGKRIGGRVVASSHDSITVDSIDDVKVGDEITVTLSSGEIETKTISRISDREIVVSGGFSSPPAVQSAWVWESSTLKSQLFRVIAISEVSPLEYSITATKYIEGKHDNIDFGTVLSQRPIVSMPENIQSAPKNIRAESNSSINQTLAVTTATVMWDAPQGAVRYEMEWRKDADSWTYAGVAYSTEMDIVGIYEGNYSFRVRAINSLGITSSWAYSENIYLYGKEGIPPEVAFLRTRSEIFGIRLEWGFPEGAEDTLYTQIQYNTIPDELDALSLGEFAYPTATHLLSGLRSAQRYYFRARLVDRTGNIGEWSGWEFGESSGDADEILDYIVGKITETELSDKLKEDIGKIENIETQLSELLGAEEWDSSTAYLEGSLVVYDGAIYRAIQDTPAGTLPSDDTYWDKIGDYTSIGDAISALAAQVDSMQQKVDDVDGKMSAQVATINGITAQLRPKRADGDKADALRGWYNQAAIQETRKAFADEQEATAERVLTLQAQINDNVSFLQEEQRVRADADSALAQQIETLEAEVGEDIQAKIQQVTEAVAEVDGRLNTAWSVRMRVNNKGQYVYAGVGLGIENDSAGNLTSQFLVEADRFALLNTVDGVSTSPFLVDGGQVYMNSAIIKQADIVNAVISGALQSPNYVENTSGIRLNFVTGEFELNGSIAGEGRMNITNHRIEVRDGDGNLRVRMGRL